VDLSKLQRGEFIALVGGVLVLAGLFLDWYTTKGRGEIDGITGAQSGWEVHTILPSRRSSSPTSSSATMH